MDDPALDKLPPAQGYAWLHVVNVALLLAHWGFAIVAYAGLPELVPGHVGSAGVTRWDPKQSSPWFILPVISTIAALMVYGMALATSSTPASVNVPSKGRFMALPPEGQRYAMAPLQIFMYGLATWTLLLMIYNQYEMYRIAHAGPGKEVAGANLLTVALIMLTVVIAHSIYATWQVRRRIGQWEAMRSSADGTR
jgi:hypothetical protein